jgi:hypothetical protein
MVGVVTVERMKQGWIWGDGNFQLAGIFGGLFFLELRSGVIEQDRSDGKHGDEF